LIFRSAERTKKNYTDLFYLKKKDQAIGQKW